MDILADLAEFAAQQLPKMPTEVPFFFIEAYASELADGWTEEATLWATDGQRHSGYSFRSSVEAGLAALFHGMYSTLFVNERVRARTAEGAFNSFSVPIRDEGIDMLVAWIASLRPTSDLISVGIEQSPGWRRFVDPNVGERTRIVRWIRFRLRTGYRLRRMQVRG